jgi:hypothetical protein
VACVAATCGGSTQDHAARSSPAARQALRAAVLTYRGCWVPLHARARTARLLMRDAGATVSWHGARSWSSPFFAALPGASPCAPALCAPVLLGAACCKCVHRRTRSAYCTLNVRAWQAGAPARCAAPRAFASSRVSGCLAVLCLTPDGVCVQQLQKGRRDVTPGAMQHPSCTRARLHTRKPASARRQQHAPLHAPLGAAARRCACMIGVQP